MVDHSWEEAHQFEKEKVLGNDDHEDQIVVRQVQTFGSCSEDRGQQSEHEAVLYHCMLSVESQTMVEDRCSGDRDHASFDELECIHGDCPC